MGNSHTQSTMHPDSSRGPNDGDLDTEANSYDSSNATLLHGGHKESARGSGLGILAKLILVLRHSLSKASRMPRRALVRTIFNYPERDEELRSTAWLDGLRGLAAFEVFIFHYCDGWMDRTLSYGGTQHGRWDWYYLPMIRTIFNGGDAAVCLFFAISGYALSYRILQQLRRGQQDRILASLSSSYFRRGIRLYTPVFATTLILMLAVRIFGLPKPQDYESQPTFVGELIMWFWSFVWLLLPLYRVYHFERKINRYDGGISWTIPMEYYGSIQVYTGLLFLCRMRSIMVRRIIMIIWIIHSIFRDDWAAAQFTVGMALADYQIERETPGSHGFDSWFGKSFSGSVRRVPRLKTLCLIGLFSFGWYLGGAPGFHWIDLESKEAVEPRMFYDWLVHNNFALELYKDLHQVDRWYMCLAACCMFIAIAELPRLRRLMETRPVQYLGKISFGLYLCHIFVRAYIKPIKTLSLAITGINPWATDVSHIHYFITYLIYMVPALTINLFVAGNFERMLDRPSVNLGKKFELWCLSWSEEHSHQMHAPVPLQEVNGVRTRDTTLPE